VSWSILIVLAILVTAIVLFVTEKLRVDLVALLVMLSLALTGVLRGEQAIAGFSNEAVITIASVLILSGGLMRTGVAHLIGRNILRYAGRRPGRLIPVLMMTVGILSGFMNDIGVTALMLPVVLEIARRITISPSKLLMPLAFASLLGGMTTLIGTAPNILISGALLHHGFGAFDMFDFTPVGLAALVVGVLYMSFVGRHILPDRDPRRQAAEEDLESVYELDKVLGNLLVPEGSLLAGRSLAESRLGHALGLNVVAVRRERELVLAPGTDFILRSGDELLTEGPLDRFEALRAWHHLVVESTTATLDRISAAELDLLEADLGEESPLVGRTILEADLRRRLGIHVLGIEREGEIRRTRLRELRLEPTDRLLLSAVKRRRKEIIQRQEFSTVRPIAVDEVAAKYRLGQRMLSVKVPKASLLAGQLLTETRRADAFGLTVLAILRDGEVELFPDPSEALAAGDVLLLRGHRRDLETLQALQGLEVSEEPKPGFAELESELVGLVEASLSPRTTLAGKGVAELNFRDKYGVSILAIWRNGAVHSSGLAEMTLKPGDAFLLYGDRRRLNRLVENPDFYILSKQAQAPPRQEKAPVSALIMGGVLVTVVTGLLPVYIAAPCGALLMVLTGCLTIEEAYRSIELKAVILIAGMLSLGLAMEETGAATLVAEKALGSLAGLGPRALIAGLFLITALSAQIMPTAAVAVLMSPIALSTAATAGLSPQALLMVLAVGASCAFMSPVGHAVNLLVMGFGGYKFTDYTKVGLPLTLLLLLLVVFFLPLVWPL
jgi:di/tricarboxylate transporter